jgi:uncharacterized RDD family membrane protein YckC/TM2 domain-containing membrane protein YozV
MSNSPKSQYSHKSLTKASLFCYFLGMVGAHRFYLGKHLTGLLQLFTLGGVGIWWIIDLILLGQEKFTDIYNRKLTWNYKHHERAGFTVRLLAYSLDLLIINVVINFFYFILMLDELVGEEGVLGINLSLIRAFVILSYFVLFSFFYGATPGKIIFNLEIQDLKDSQISFVQSLVRYLAYFISYIFLVGFIMVAFRRDKMSMHDLIAGTKVVYVDYSRSLS